MRLIILSLCLVTAGCGLKGNLYLPPEAMEPASSTTGDPDSAATGEAAPSPTAPDTIPPEQPEPDEAIEGTDDFDNRSRKGALQ
jgi:predicted small lipoprotein YifL